MVNTDNPELSVADAAAPPGRSGPRFATATHLIVASLLVTGAGCAGEDFSITASSDPTTTAPTTIAPTTTAPTTKSTTDGRSPEMTTGATDVGDPLIPGSGNGGYDVAHYDLRFEMGATRTEFAGRTKITATATSPLGRFNLDLSGFEVSAVTVDGERAAFDRAGAELTITPTQPIDRGARFSTVVTYAGEAEPIQDPAGLGTIGWMSGPSGSFIAAEPIGAHAIFPCNDHPSDKASFTVVVNTDADDTVVANGTHTAPKVTGDRAEWTFDQREDMATYLLQIAIGDYRVITSEMPNGVGIRHAVAASADPKGLDFLDETDEQIAFFSDMFGPYPFENYGVLLAELDQGFALETQTLSILPVAMTDPLYAGSLGISGVAAHELAHQWFGNSVTIGHWSDIWLNEGMATYAEWMWSDHAGRRPLTDAVSSAEVRSPEFRQAFGAIAEPEIDAVFSPNMYDGAALAIHALRLEVGDEAFFDILRAWLDTKNGSSVSTSDFEKTATAVTGRDLSAFFDAWLRSVTVPDLPDRPR